MAIEKLNVWLQRTIPQVYDDSMSFYELLETIKKKLDEVIDETNLYFDGTYIEDHVDTMLTGWKDDGTLDAIINQNIFNDLNRKVDERLVSIENYPLITPETDDTARVQRALDGNIGKTLLFPFGKTYTLQRINLRSNTKLMIDGTVQASALLTTEIFYGQNISNVSLMGNMSGKLVGHTAEGLTAITFEGVTNFIVDGLHIEGFKNKGVSIGDNCKNGNISSNFIDGSNGSTGAGISLFGNNCERVNVTDNHIKTSRIGITANGGREHNISDNQLYDNTLAGIMLDGIVTGSGDGTKSSIVKGNIVTGTTASTYAGIYTGNGASDNIISNNISNDNARSGIRHTAAVGYEGRRNKYIGNTVKGNAYHGFEFSYNLQMVIEGNTVEGNTQRGIAAVFSDEAIVSNNQVRGNIGTGILWQSAKSLIVGNKCKNNDKGLEIAFGGTNPPSGNIVAFNDCEANTTSQIVNASTNTYRNNVGYVSDNKGLYMANGDGATTTFTFPHGLSATPVYVGVTPNHATVNGDFTVTFDATNIIVTFKVAPAIVTNGVKLVWKAEL
jgi:parallel beta-helix repeat protein